MNTPRVLYVTDLDGTLLNKESHIPPEALSILNALEEKGLLFTYATSRSFLTARKVTAGLNISHPVVVFNGTFIMDPLTGRILVSEQFRKEEKEYIQQILEDNDVSPMIYAFLEGRERVSWMVGTENEGIQHYLKVRKNDERLRSVQSKAELYKGDIFYYLCIGEKRALEPIYEFFSKDERFTCMLQQEIYRPEYLLEIMPRKATKAEGIKKVKQMLNCDRLISFGDGINDIPMFQISDECYAVENAVDALKQLATGIIKGNDEGGVALWLRENGIFTKEEDLP